MIQHPMPAIMSQSRQAAFTPKSSRDPHPAKKQKTIQRDKSRKASLQSIIPQNGETKKRTSAVLNGSKNSPRLHRFNEEQAVIKSGREDDVDMEDAVADQAIGMNVESEEEISADVDDEEEDTRTRHKVPEMQDKSPRSSNNAHRVENKTDNDDDEEDEDVRPSFGDLIDVDNALAVQDPESRTLSTPISSSRAVALPSGNSLGTVLTQALKTNDKVLLESCFQINDLDSVRSTIQRLESPLVSSLLQRLAERIHKKPGRAGNLMVWVQWSLVAHGGYLAGQPDVMQKLQDLHRVIKERANGLQPLLALKGKLDMLNAQLELRKSMQRSAIIGEDDDEAAIYVEGQESDSESDVVDSSAGRKRVPETYSEDSGDDGVDMPNTHNDSEAEDDEGEESERLLDEEAEETDRDSGDDMSEVESDEESDDEDISDPEGESTTPLRRSKAAARSALR